MEMIQARFLTGSGADLDRVVQFGKPGTILLENWRNFLENVFAINSNK